MCEIHENIIRDREKLFLFVELGRESTNNRAVRAIKPAVITERYPAAAA